MIQPTCLKPQVWVVKLGVDGMSQCGLGRCESENTHLLQLYAPPSPVCRPIKLQVGVSRISDIHIHRFMQCFFFFFFFKQVLTKYCKCQYRWLIQIRPIKPNIGGGRFVSYAFVSKLSGYNCFPFHSRTVYICYRANHY